MEYFTNFVNKLQKAYDKNYNDIQIQDIIDLLEDNNISEERCKFLYQYLIDNNKFLPKRKEIKDAFEHSRSSFKSSDSIGLHPQSPYRALEIGKDMSCDEIVKHCKKIRQMYDSGAEVSGKRLSFLTFWECLVGLEASDAQVAKGLVLEDNRDELYNFLDVVTKKVPIGEIEMERSGKMVKLNDLMTEFMK